MSVTIQAKKVETSDKEEVKADKSFKVSKLKDTSVELGKLLELEVKSTKEDIQVEWQSNRGNRWSRLDNGANLSLKVGKGFNGIKVRALVTHGTNTISTNAITVSVKESTKLASKAYPTSIAKTPTKKVSKKDKKVEEAPKVEAPKVDSTKESKETKEPAKVEA